MVFSTFLFCNLPSGVPCNFILWPGKCSQREEGGSNGQSVPLPRWIPWFGALPVSAIGRMVGHLGQESPSEAFPCSVQGSDTPLRWSLHLALSALAFVGSRSSQLRTQTRTGLPRAQKLSTGANGRTYRGYAGWGVFGLESALMLRHTSFMVQHRSLTGLPSSWGFGLCGAPKACRHPTA